MRSLRLALSLLTVVPVGSVEPDPVTSRDAILLAPLAGAVAAAPGLLVLLACDGPSLVVSALAVGLLALMTGGLHWDGLADTADGVAVPRGRSDALTVMQRPDLGPIGALVIGLVLLLEVGALSSLTGNNRAASWLVAVLLSRAALALVCIRGTPAARPEGLGAMLIGRVPRSVALVPAIVVVVAAVLIETDPLRAAIAGLAALGVAWTVRTAAIRRLSGLTGDVLGAVVEMTTATYLVVLCLG